MRYDEQQRDQMLLELFKTLSQTIEHAVDFDKKSVRRDLNHFNKTLADLKHLVGIDQGVEAAKKSKEGPEEEPE